MLVLVVGITAVSGMGNETERSKLLIVDETSSIEISMRVQGFVRTLKKRSNVKVLTRMVKTENPTANPLKNSKNLTVDAVVIVPSTIETGKVEQVWIATRPYSAVPLKAREKMMKRTEQLKNGVEKAFSGKINAVGVNDDVIPAYFSTLFLREGILR